MLPVIKENRVKVGISGARLKERLAVSGQRLVERTRVSG